MGHSGPGQGGVFGAKVTGIADGTDLETTARYEGCGQVTRKVRIEDKRGKVHEIEVTVYGWKVIVLIDAATKIPLAVKVGPIQEHETLWAAGLGHAGADQSGWRHARLHKVVFDKGFLDGTDLWWLDQHGIPFVVPAKDEHGGDGRCPGPSRGWRRCHGRPPGAYGPPWAGQNGLDRTAGDRGGGDHRADDL